MALPIAGKLLKGVAKKGGLGDLASNKLGMMLAFPTLLIVFLGDFIGKMVYWVGIMLSFLGGGAGTIVDISLFILTFGSYSGDFADQLTQYGVGMGFYINVIFSLITSIIVAVYAFLFFKPNDMERFFLLLAALTSLVLPFPAICIAFTVMLILKLVAREKKEEKEKVGRDEEPPRERGGLHTQMEST